MQNLTNKIKYLFTHFLSVKEILFLLGLSFLSIFLFLSFLHKASSYIMSERIIYTGNIREGVIGSPKETNPYQAEGQTDKDLHKLLFSSLVEAVPLKNFKTEYVPRLAERIEVSNDGNTYKVILRDNLQFSNGQPITLNDITYSLSSIPLEKNYIVEKTSENSLTFKLKKSDSNFLDNLTYPIIQKDQNFENNFSTDLVTSSFLKIKDIEKDEKGNVTHIVLQRYDNGEEKIPYIKTYSISYFKDEVTAYDAFQKKEVDLLSGVSGNTFSKVTDDPNLLIDSAPLPNNFAIFLNQNKNEYLRNNSLRQALNDVVDRESLTNQVLGKFGIPEKNILGDKGTVTKTEEIIDNLDTSFSFEDGVLYSSTKKASETKGDKDNSSGSKGEAIKIKLTTIQNKELVETAKFLQIAWKKIGVETEIQVIDRKDLSNVVKDRDFEALLFGFSIKSEKDYYSFFSSKERSYPKLNISNYTSKQTDKILDVLSGNNSDERVKDLLNQLSVEIAADNPIIILYKPQFVFAHFGALQIKLPETIKTEDDRYVYIENWYTNTEKVLSFFKQSKIINKLDSLFY